MAKVATLEHWQRSGSHRFDFLDRKLDRSSGKLVLLYLLDDILLEERIVLPPTASALSPAREQALDRALDLLHWVAGISYWKTSCSGSVSFAHRQPDQWQADWLNQLYRHGLAEFAYRNRLTAAGWQPFAGSGGPATAVAAAGLARRSLVPMGGGKDSLVAWSRLQRQGHSVDSIQIGASALIRQIGERLPGRHWQIVRHLDPGLAQLNARGAWNGHVPVTAINAAILVVAALWLDYDQVVFANERSAEEASLIDEHGAEVNHQFSKSHAFERMFDEWIRRYLASDLRVFSILRRDRELAICREFAGLTEFHQLFSSCNRNFHLDGPRTERWCGQCPKCHFVYLGLAPFMQPARMQAIFGRDLLADSSLTESFAELLALDGAKPFECVGEADEARAAVQALTSNPDWAQHSVVRALAPRLAGLAVPSLEALCRPGGPSLIPPEFLDAA
jgi:UDP-N-acetyl-alpha-D-muramoyl-L-alanyl-L-glutamate epimerase